MPGYAVHPAADLLPMMTEAELAELAADIAQHGLQEPVVFWADNTAQKESGQFWGLEQCPTFLLDGRSRLAAIDRLRRRLDDMRCLTKTPQTSALVIPAWRRKPQPVIGAWGWRYVDPWDYVVSANVRRRHLTPELKREVIAKLLAAKPELSDRAIAKQTKSSPTTVGKVRKANVQSGHKPERVEADGRRARGRKPLSAVERRQVAEAEVYVPPDWRASKSMRFLSPVKWNAPRAARIVAARAYLDYLDLTVDDLTERSSQ